MSVTRSAKPAKKDKEGARTPPRGTRARVQLQAPLLEPSLAAVDALCAETLALCLTTDVRPLAGAAGYVDWRLCGGLSRMLLSGIVTGAAGEKVLMPTGGLIPPLRIFLFGWGESERLQDVALERFQWMVEILDKARVSSVAVALPEPADRLLGLVDAHLGKPLGSRLAGVFDTDPLLL